MEFLGIKMSGILNSKTRIFDTVITSEGRRQMALGDLQIKFVSFTDNGTFYRADIVSGSDDAGKRIYLETSNLPQDKITFESDDSGLLKPFPADELGIIGGKVLSGSSEKFLQIVTGSQFASLGERILSSSLGNFKKLRIIGSSDLFSETEGFSISQNEIDFNLTDNHPIRKNSLKVASIDDVEGIFQDKRLSHLLNFRHLPPINRPDIKSPKGSSLGEYPSLGQAEILTFEELQKELEGKESAVINFDRTSRSNNIVSQFFEQRQNSISKLDVIDFGDFLTSDTAHPDKRVFFSRKDIYR